LRKEEEEEEEEGGGGGEGGGTAMPSNFNVEYSLEFPDARAYGQSHGEI
jgi:hypothetical protein